MNVKLLRKVAKHIKAMPKRYTYNWAHESDETPCRTQACIAGWTIILGARLHKPFDENGELRIPERLADKGDEGTFSYPARKLLRITAAQASRLFIHWPQPFDSFLRDADMAVKRIEHFIKTKGKE